MQVLQAAIRCEAGMYLTNESVCKAYQAAFMLGNLDAGRWFLSGQGARTPLHSRQALESSGSNWLYTHPGRVGCRGWVESWQYPRWQPHTD
jgi:hypothetical protein